MRKKQVMGADERQRKREILEAEMEQIRQRSLQQLEETGEFSAFEASLAGLSEMDKAKLVVEVLGNLLGCSCPKCQGKRNPKTEAEGDALWEKIIERVLEPEGNGLIRVFAMVRVAERIMTAAGMALARLEIQRMLSEIRGDPSPSSAIPDPEHWAGNTPWQAG